MATAALATGARVALVCVVALLAPACRKRRPPLDAPAKGSLGAAPAAPDAGSVRCPGPEALAALLHEPGRALRTDCLVYSPVYFWTAAALSYDEKDGGHPRLALVTGGTGLGYFAYDVEPAPTEAITKLIRGSRVVEARVRKTRSQHHLVRLGVVGRREEKGLDSEEVAVVLELVAHSSPHLLWAGSGDQVKVGQPGQEDAGCVTERLVDFEMPFRRDLEMFTAYRSRPTGSDKAARCSSSPGTQEAVSARGVPLPRGRTLGPPADAGARR